MQNNVDLFNQTISEIKKLWSDNIKLSDFVNFPNNLILKEKPINSIAVTQIFSNWKSEGNQQTDKVHNLLSNLSNHVNWQNGYDKKDANIKFLENFGFFELIGPTGHFISSEMALYVNFINEKTYYPWHNHEAEELYFVISGEAKFDSENEDPMILKSKDTRFHKKFQPHSIITTSSKILSIVIWKNKFENVSKMIDFKKT